MHIRSRRHSQPRSSQPAVQRLIRDPQAPPRPRPRHRERSTVRASRRSPFLASLALSRMVAVQGAATVQDCRRWPAQPPTADPRPTSDPPHAVAGRWDGVPGSNPGAGQRVRSNSLRSRHPRVASAREDSRTRPPPNVAARGPVAAPPPSGGDADRARCAHSTA